MPDWMRYLILVIFLLVVIAIIWILKDGFSVRSSGFSSLSTQSWPGLNVSDGSHAPG